MGPFVGDMDQLLPWEIHKWGTASSVKWKGENKFQSSRNKNDGMMGNLHHKTESIDLVQENLSNNKKHLALFD